MKVESSVLGVEYTLHHTCALEVGGGGGGGGGVLLLLWTFLRRLSFCSGRIDTKTRKLMNQ